MGHITTKAVHQSLEERINRFTQGAPATPTLYKILQVLFSEEEARLVSLLPVRPFTVSKAAKVWGVGELEAEKALDRLCEKALLLDASREGIRHFVLPPPMAGFFEFALMRVRKDIDQKYLSELYFQYMNVEEDFIKDLFFASETKLGRVFVQEPVLSGDNALHILDYERASHILQEAEHIGLGLCYCRHKASHLGHACAAPWDVCLTLDDTAASLARHGHARLISLEEGMDALERSYAANLVQIGENVREHPAFICNCCGCCCEALQAARRFGPLQPVSTTGFLPKLEAGACTGCGLCAKACPIQAITMETIQPPAEDQEMRSAAKFHGLHRRRAVIDEAICLGCGVCLRNCPSKALRLEKRPVQIITPVNSTHRFVLQAIEKGTLQNLIFDNQAFASHRAMAAVLAVILKLPPLKRALASQQLKSVYLDKLLAAKKD